MWPNALSFKRVESDWPAKMPFLPFLYCTTVKRSDDVWVYEPRSRHYWGGGGGQCGCPAWCLYATPPLGL